MKTILRVNGGEQDLFYILCKRVVNGETAYLEESYVRRSVFPGIENEDVCRVPFYDLMQEKGAKKILKVVQTIEVTEARGERALLLRIPEGAPALLLHRLLIGPDASPIAYTRLFGIGKKYKIMTEFERIR
jgi:DNA-binding GntR family transcriptional regulator